MSNENMYRWILKKLDRTEEYHLAKYTVIKNIQFEANHSIIVRIWILNNESVWINREKVEKMKYYMDDDIITFGNKTYKLHRETINNFELQNESGIETDLDQDSE